MHCTVYPYHQSYWARVCVCLCSVLITYGERGVHEDENDDVAKAHSGVVEAFAEAKIRTRELAAAGSSRWPLPDHPSLLLFLSLNFGIVVGVAFEAVLQ